MKPIYLKLPRTTQIDHDMVSEVLKDYNAPNEKIHFMVKSGELIRLKKGMYIISPEYGGNVNLFSIANCLYGPSYISFEKALSYWRLIPEQVVVITSATTGRNKIYNTPIGNFTYKHIPSEYFVCGVKRVEDEGVPFLIASKEKALFDMLYKAPLIRSVKEIEELLTEDYRIEIQDLKEFNLSDIEEIHNVCGTIKTGLLVKFLRQVIKDS